MYFTQVQWKINDKCTYKCNPAMAHDLGFLGGSFKMSRCMSQAALSLGMRLFISPAVYYISGMYSYISGCIYISPGCTYIYLQAVFIYLQPVFISNYTCISPAVFIYLLLYLYISGCIYNLPAVLISTWWNI